MEIHPISETCENNQSLASETQQEISDNTATRFHPAPLKRYYNLPDTTQEGQHLHTGAVRTVVVLAHGELHGSAHIHQSLGRRWVFQLTQDVLRGHLPLASHEVGVELRLGDEEVELALLTLGLESGITRNTMRRIGMTSDVT